ncbi:MAG: glycosyltransferase family 2 protein [Chloroflexota bacterium]
MLDVFGYLILFSAIVPAAMSAYLCLLTMSAWVMHLREGKKVTPVKQHRFAFIIPAHNEEKLLNATLDNLKADLKYPKDSYDIVVIADNCSDRTAEIAKNDAIVFERHNYDKRGKGYALEWGLEQYWQNGYDADAIIILDADTIVSNNFLDEVNQHFDQGQEVIQCFYSVLNPAESWSAGLRYAALAVLHYVRPLGRSLFGGSAGLKGNGMVFSADVIKNHSWSSSLTEDIEFHMDLLLSGQKVYFAPNATIWAEMPNSIQDADSQNERWETGRLDMAKKYVPKLLRKGFSGSGNSIAQLDAVMEHVIPPFAIFNAISLLLLIISAVYLLFAPSVSLAWFNFYLTLFILGAQIVYLLSGLIQTNAPSSVYRNLLYAPLYVIWKLLLVLRIFGKKEAQDNWIRTTRNEIS